MEKFKCLIIEDEPLAAEILQDYIAQVPLLVCTGTCRDALYAMQVLQQETVDVIFLDIHLPGIKGLDFLRTLQHPPKVIITTAYREYALDGYELSVVDYLLKPIHFNRFISAVNKLKVNERSLLPPSTNSSLPTLPDAQHLLVTVNKKKIKIYLRDILFIESRKEYVHIALPGKTIITRLGLTEMETLLPGEKFLRIHRSFIIALDKLDAFSATAIDVNGQSLPVGRKYREQVQQVLKDKGRAV